MRKQERENGKLKDDFVVLMGGRLGADHKYLKSQKRKCGSFWEFQLSWLKVKSGMSWAQNKVVKSKQNKSQSPNVVPKVLPSFNHIYLLRDCISKYSYIGS